MVRRREALVVYTIGHSTRTLEEFVKLLKAHGVRQVVDIRTIPRSRRNPQFNRESLPGELRAKDIGYTHLANLGGLRKPLRDSRNLGWRNSSFRGFADYMQTPEFAAGVKRLLKLAQARPSAVMCAEAVPWRCHRSMVADALVIRGVEAKHILSGKRAEPHKLTSFAHVRAHRITYPSAKDGKKAEKPIDE